MSTNKTYEATAKLSKLVAEVERSGKPVTICRNGKPVVDLVPHRPAADPLAQDPELEGARFHGDPCAPVDSEDWPDEGR